MPDAKVLCGVQVQQTLASPFGQYAITRLLGNDAMTRLAAATGFEMQRDLHEILVVSSTPGSPGDGADALVLARGTFAPDKFIALATVTGATVSDYHGVSVIMPQERGARAFAFLDSSTWRSPASRLSRVSSTGAPTKAAFPGTFAAESQGCQRHRRCLVRHDNSPSGTDPGQVIRRLQPRDAAAKRDRNLGWACISIPAE